MPTLTSSLLIGLAAAALAGAYYPGSPDRNLSVLQTAEITPDRHLFMRFDHRFEDPISPEGENNPFYHALGMDGAANIYIDLAAGFGNRWEFTLARERRYKTYGLEAKAQAWNHRVEGGLCSVALTLNTQLRTEREVEKDKRHSFGGSLILERSLWEDRLGLVFNGLAQSHSNVDQSGASPDHSMAAGTGLIGRYHRISFFGEWIFPLRFGDRGYRDVYPGRAGNGIPLQAYGFNYRIKYHSFALLVGNYTDVLAANYIAGAHRPGETRLQEWRLGFNLNRTFSPAR